jgi:hypothetical protein
MTMVKEFLEKTVYEKTKVKKSPESIINLRKKEKEMKSFIFSKTEVEKARTVLEELLAENELLNPSGWAPATYYEDCTFENGFEAHRRSLPDRTEEFLRVCSWLKGVPNSDKSKDRFSSYLLKHIAEKQVDMYIPNGVFIAAALHMGCKVKMPGKDDQNPYIYLDAKTVKKEREAAGL